jgi:hypothetical protein
MFAFPKKIIYSSTETAKQAAERALNEKNINKWHVSKMEISQFPQNFAKAQFKADEFTFNKQPQILFDSQNRGIS